MVRVRVVFDLDGTLVDSTEALRHAWSQATGGSPAWPGLGPSRCEWLGTGPEADRQGALKDALYPQALAERGIALPAARVARELIDAGVSVAVVTKASRSGMEAVLEFLGLDPNIRVSVHHGDKVHALRVLKAEDHTVVYVGDEDEDREAASAAGVAFLNVREARTLTWMQ